MSQHYLRHLFVPQSIAVFGASDSLESVGGRVFGNLQQAGFSGPVYPVNPAHQQVQGAICYAAIGDIRQAVDLAVIATPAATVADLMHDCGKHGVRAVIIITAGFSERGAQGTELEQSVVAIAREYKMRIMGPNCLGLMHPSLGLNATFSKSAALPGRLALISQSGALCTAILDWAQVHEVGFSLIASLGNAADVDFGDVLDYLAQDPETHSILLYVEGIRNARSFMSGLRAAARLKPVIVVKAGRHQEGSRAASTHTGAIVGADDVFAAALQRAGVVRAITIEQLFAAAQLLATPWRIQGQRLAIITNGGGLGVMATDRAIDLGIELAPLAQQTINTLNQALPEHWSHANPIDVLGDASPQRYLAAVKACLQDPGVDGIVVLLSPQAMTDGSACARAVISAAAGSDKPVLACWMGEQQLRPAKELFAAHHVPEFNNPESCVEAFSYLAAYHRNQQLLLQVPGPLAASSDSNLDEARQIIRTVLAEQRSMLDTIEAKALLQAFMIPVAPCRLCRSGKEAVLAADALGYPVAMKIHSRTISHKSDVGGVRLNISNAQTLEVVYQELLAEVHRKAPDALIEGVTIETMYSSDHGRELLIGVVRDPVFGPAISFGAGGINVEVLRDRAIALPPLNTFLIDTMINQTRVATLLDEYRGKPAINKAALIQVLRRVSELVCELPEVIALDINPLVADEHGVMALDARIEVRQVPASRDAYAHMAIHPYPAHLVSGLKLDDGTEITIRPIRPEDAAIETSFVESLSAQTRYFRFMQELKELTREMLVRFTQLDYDRELALIAVLDHKGERGETELGVARYMMNPDGNSCEFALVVADAWQGRGIGTQLMTRLIDAARVRGFRTMNAEVIASNSDMLQLVKELGFSIEQDKSDSAIQLVTKRLQG